VQPEMQNFDDIRPYSDAEVPQAIEQIISDPEFTQAIIRYKFGRAFGVISPMVKPLLGWYLRRHWRRLQTVEQVQHYVAGYLQQALEHTTDGISCHGLEKLDPQQSYLFICNHRDIAMDPALVNWCLHQHGFATSRIAIGDNLLKKPCVTALMKLNKSFVVRRSAKGPREMLKALSQLSAYIRHSLQQGHHIWIAQKEGRAKDGFDQTDPAILKMFFMAGKAEGIEFADYMRSLRIVPVAISYEYDPCDEAKARELYQKANDGAYQKAEFEDIDSIIKGITGYKGRIHLQFGDVMQDGFDTPEQLAALIDQQIYQGYRIYPANQSAAGETPSEAEAAALFGERLAQMAPEVRSFVRDMYANPLRNYKKALGQ
jgi:1-acyl-sn-glycerol-3-phosphate acyltransferase